MSNIARRSIRTTAAAAGIAALGIGIAGPALAAPSVSDLPELPAPDTASAPALDTAVPGMADFTRAADTAHAGLPTLPGAFTFDAPAAEATPSSDASPAPAAKAPALPSIDALAVPTEMNAASLPSVPGTGGVLNTEGTGFDVQGSPSSASAENISDNGGALAVLDTAKTFAGLAQKAASGQSMTANNDISN